MQRLDRTATIADVAARLDEDGFAIIERYLDPGDVAAKKADLQRILRSTPTGRNNFEGFSTQRIYALFAKTRAFDQQAIDPLVLGALEHALGPSYQLSAPVGISIGPGEKAQSLHRDDGVYPLPPGFPEVVVNTMWAMDDFTEENGATRVVPGSHRWSDGRRPTPDDAVIQATMPAGSVLIFLGNLFHGGGANSTDRPRLGVILEYCAGWLRPQENHFLGVPRAIARDLPERLQELLGYNIHGNLVGNVDGRHPKKYLVDDTREVQAGVLVL